MWGTILVITLASLVYLYFKKSYQYWTRRNVPQLCPSFPFGDMASVILRQQNMGDKVREIYNYGRNNGHKYVGVYFFSRKALLPIDPTLVKNILCQDFAHFHDRGIYFDEENDPLSAHLFSLYGSKWKHLRTKLTPAFSPGKIKYMLGTMVECGNQMIDLLVRNKETTVEIKELLARYTTDVIGSTAFGIECNSMNNPDAEFRLMGKRAFTQTVGDALKMIIMRSFPSVAKLLKLGVFTPKVTAFFQQAVHDTINYREQNQITRNDFLQLLIQLKKDGQLEHENGVTERLNESNTMKNNGKNNALTMNEAAAQAFIFFLAGFETTSTTISFAIFEMALNYEIQEKARKEIILVLEKYKGEITYEAAMEFNYLETVILETMRKYPPAPVFLRKCTEDYKIPETDITIEKGLSVLIPCYGLHQDPEYYPEPEKFNPDRFNNENKSKLCDYTYIPFGDGPRNCIGMRFAMIQIKIALSLILKNFHLSLNKRTKLPLKMETQGILLAPIGGLWIDLQKVT